MAKGKHEAPSTGRTSRVRYSTARHESRHAPASAVHEPRPARSRSRRRRKNLLPLLAALVLIMGMAVGGTMAYLTDSSEALSETYVAGRVACQVQEDYKVKNTGNIDAYIRVALVQSFVDEAGNICLEHQDIVPGTPQGWTYKDSFYYCAQKLAPGDVTVPLISPAGTTADDSCSLKLEVFAYAIQAEPASASLDAWGYTPGA